MDPREPMLSRGARALKGLMRHEAVHLFEGVEAVGAHRASRFERGPMNS